MIRTIIMLAIIASISFAMSACGPQGGAPAGQSQSGSGIIWETGLKKAMKLSLQTGKPVMADFDAEWCGWKRKFDCELYGNPEIIKASALFINVKVNTDSNQAEADRCGVKFIPTMVFMDYNGKVLNKIEGYADAPALLEVMNALTKGKQAITK